MTITLTREEAQQVLDAMLSQYEQPPINVPIIELLRARLAQPEQEKTMDALSELMNLRIEVETLRARLAQPEPEPVAWLDSEGFPWSKEGVECRTTKDTYEPLYTAPPQREWQGLTAYEIQELHLANPNWGNFACAIEAKLKEKNT